MLASCTHPIVGDELRALRRLQRDQEPKSPFVFTSERGAPFTSAGFARMIERAAIEAKFGFKPHPHMLRHACGYRSQPAIHTPTPRLAIDSYWRAHPIRADRLARALAARSSAPAGWTWQLGDDRKNGLPLTFRTTPAPYRERAYAQGPGFCCVCGQPVYRFGWHVDLWDSGANKNATWHSACAIAWEFLNAPSGDAALLRPPASDAVVKLANGYGRAPRLTTAFPCFECGANIGICRGRRCLIFGLAKLSSD